MLWMDMVFYVGRLLFLVSNVAWQFVNERLAFTAAPDADGTRPTSLLESMQCTGKGYAQEERERRVMRR
jgi:hypothetical protein